MACAGAMVERRRPASTAIVHSYQHFPGPIHWTIAHYIERGAEQLASCPSIDALYIKETGAALLKPFAGAQKRSFPAIKAR